jgi:antitoxin (DNA-binding transcriptional repressor) of toxin-antitoxin stability system
MTIITLDSAGEKLPDLVAGVRAGQEIVISADGQPVAKLVALHVDRPVRVPGGMKGQLDMPDDFFFEPLPADEPGLWEGGGVVPK